MPRRTLRLSILLLATAFVPATLLTAPRAPASPPADPAPATRPAAAAAPADADAARRAAEDAVDQAAFVRDLLDGPSAGRPAPPGRRVQNLMAEAARRLTEDGDAGAGTQRIQRQIVDDIDDLIRQLESSPPPRPANPSDPPPARPPATGPSQPAPGQGKPPGAPTPPAGRPGPAGTSPTGGDGPDAVDASSDLRQTARDWARISPRLVGPMIEGRAERVCDEKYRGLVDDYYRAVATKATE